MDIPNRPLRTATLLCVILACLYISTVQVSGVDFWLQAKIGELIVTDGRIPDTVLFPYTEISTEKFNAHEWLTSIAFHFLIKTLGTAGLAIFTGLLGLVFFLLTLQLGYIRSEGNYPVALLGAMAAIATENYRHILRPELISLLVMAVYWISLEKFRRTSNWVWGSAAAALAVIWVNCHGSFILAPIMASIYCVGIHLDSLRDTRTLWQRPTAPTLHWAALSILIMSACLVNPFGWEMIRFVFTFSNTSKLDQAIGEWMPTLQTKWFHLPGFRIALTVWLLSVATLVWRRRSVSAIDVLFFLFFTLLAIKAVRFPLYLGLCFAYLASGLLSEFGRISPVRQRLELLALSVSLLTIMLATQYGNAHEKKPFSPGFYKFSDEMVRVLSDPSYHGNVLNSMELGAELIYVAYPRLKPSSDCRVDSFGLDYLDFLDSVQSNDKLFAEFVERYDVRYLLLQPHRFTTFQGLDAWKSGQWQVVAIDKTSVFLKRNEI